MHFNKDVEFYSIIYSESEGTTLAVKKVFIDIPRNISDRPQSLCGLAGAAVSASLMQCRHLPCIF